VLIDDIVQATVRAMISYEEIRASRGQVNLEGQGNPEQQANEGRKRYSNAEIAMLLPEFSGQGQDIETWLQRVETVELTYEVPPKVCLMTLIVVGKFTDQAKTWYHSKPEYVLLDWQGLKYEMRRMFNFKHFRDF